MTSQNTQPATPAQPNAAVTAESDFSYQPPAEVDTSAEFDQSLKDIVSEIEGEFADNKYEFSDEELAEGADTAGDPDSGGEDDAAEKPPGEPQDSPEVVRGMERLVAREVALQAKEAQITAAEQRYRAIEAENFELRKAVPQQKLLEDFETSPTEAFKSLGKDPETMVRLMIAEQLEAKGQEVPAELKEFVKEARRERRVKQLEAQIARRDQVAAAQQTFNVVSLGAHEYVKNLVGDGKIAPALAEIAKEHPDQAHAEIMEEIQRDAQSRLAQGADPNSEPLSYIDAAKRAEARLGRYKSVFGKGLASTAPTKQVGEAQKKVTPPANKPPAAPIAPLKPWQKSGNDLMEQGIKDAEREFYRQEAINRRRTART